MDYRISKTKRNLIIFSAVFLILKAIILVIVFSYRETPISEITWNIILHFTQIIANSYILIVIFGYFNHYKFKALQIITLIILLPEIAGNIITFFNQTGINVPKPVLIGNNIIWTLSMVSWIVFLFRISSVDFPGLASIRRFAISIIVTIFIAGTLPILIHNIINIRHYHDWIIVMIGVIPYIFIIDFGLKLKVNELNA
jgi:hypothetical protein